MNETPNAPGLGEKLTPVADEFDSLQASQAPPYDLSFLQAAPAPREVTGQADEVIASIDQRILELLPAAGSSATARSILDLAQARAAVAGSRYGW